MYSFYNKNIYIIILFIPFLLTETELACNFCNQDQLV